MRREFKGEIGPRDVKLWVVSTEMVLKTMTLGEVNSSAGEWRRASGKGQKNQAWALGCCKYWRIGRVRGRGTKTPDSGMGKSRQHSILESKGRESFKEEGVISSIKCLPAWDLSFDKITASSVGRVQLTLTSKAALNLITPWLTSSASFPARILPSARWSQSLLKHVCLFWPWICLLSQHL